MKRFSIALIFIFLCALTGYSQVQNQNAKREQSGAGSPNGVVSCVVGPPWTSIYINTSDHSEWQCTASPNSWTKVVSGGTPGTVSSVSGTTNQIDVATGTTTPVLSLSSTLVAPGTFRATTSITDSGLTSGRVVLVGAAGLLRDDSDFIFSTDTATITKIIASTSLTVGGGSAITNSGAGGSLGAIAFVTPGAGVATALGVDTGSAGAFVVNGGALGSPSSAGTLPALTLGGTVSGGGNQINNVIIGTTTPLAGFHTTLSATTSFVTPIIGPAADGTTSIKFTKQDLSTVVGVWDTTNTRLRIGSGVAPTTTLDVTGAALISSTLGVTGAVTGASFNGNTFTTGTYTLTGTAAKTLNFTNTLTLSGIDSTTMTFPSTSASVARIDAAQTFVGVQTFGNGTAGAPIINLGDTTTGFFRSAGSVISLTNAGTQSFDFSANDFRIRGTTPSFELGSSGSAPGFLTLADNQIQLKGTFFAIGGATSSFPALKRSTTTIAARLADDSADAGFSMSTIAASGAITQTSASATAFESGPNGSTNPVLRLVNSTASQADGLSITGLAAGSGVTLTALSSGSNAPINLTPKGTGQVFVPIGSLALPGMAFASTTGLASVSSNLNVIVGGNELARWNNGTGALQVSGGFGISMGANMTTQDVWFSRNAANIAQIGSTAANALGSIMAVNFTSTGTFSTSSTTDATTTTSGALQVAGGAAIRKRVFIDGITASSGLQTAVLCQSSGGEMIADSVACLASSGRFKENVVPLNAGLNEILSLRPVSYFYKPEGIFAKNPNFRRQRVGLIAEDVAKIDSRLVGYEADGVTPRTVGYELIVPILINAVKELSTKVDAQVKEIEMLKRQMSTFQIVGKPAMFSYTF